MSGLGLDPRDLKDALAADDYLLVRDWSAATACFNRALEIAPDSAMPGSASPTSKCFATATPLPGKDFAKFQPASIPMEK